METVDILIAVIAVIAVVGSVAGAALYEPPADGVSWQVAFSESSEEALTTQRDTDDVAASTGSDEAALIIEHDVDPIGITALKFDVSLSTDRALPRTGTVTYEAYLVAPDGTELREGDAGAEGSFGLSASFTLTVPDSYLIEVPEDTTVQAESTQAARQQINETVLQSNATGTWEVHVHIEYGQGTSPAGEQVEAESTPRLKRVIAEIGTDLDIFRGA